MQAARSSSIWRSRRVLLPLILAPVVLLCFAACANQPAAPASAPPEAVGERPAAPEAPAPTRDRARESELEQQNSRLELRILEKEAQLEELRLRLDDARREVVRAMGKLQSQATRAEAASGMAEAEIAVRSLRAEGSAQAADAAQLMKLSTAEFDRQNYAGALYLANQAKGAALAARTRMTGDERDGRRSGETSFALPIKLQTVSRANVREGPGGSFNVLFTLPAGTAVTGHSYVDQWLRVTDETGRGGWVYQTLIRRPP